MSLQGGPPYGSVPSGQVPSGHVPHQPGQNAPRPIDQRSYQPRTVQPHVRVEQPITQAPTLGQYFRSDSRSVPGARRSRWAGRLAFWLGLAAVILMWSSLIVDIPFHAPIALALSVVAIFFALVAIIAGIGRASGIWGLLLALAGNAIVVAWLGENVF